MWHVYILQSLKTRRYYIGSTSNLERRLCEHNNDINLSTRNRGPFEIVYDEMFEAREKAYRRELEIKSYKGGNSFRKLLG